jgi:hypothetical protein
MQIEHNKTRNLTLKTGIYVISPVSMERACSFSQFDGTAQLKEQSCFAATQNL